MTKETLKQKMREVPIADKTYPEYVEALADKLISEVIKDIFESIECESQIAHINGNEDNPMLLVDYGFYKELRKIIEETNNEQRKAD